MIDRIIYNIAGRVAAVAMLLFAAVGCQQRYELDLPLATNADEILVTKDAGHSYIMVYSTGNWTIALEKQVSWVALSKSEGSGNEFVQIDYQANTDLSRGVNIIITSGDLRRTVYFAQEAGMADAMYAFEENSVNVLRGAINVKMATTTNLPQSNVEMAEASVIYGEMGSDEWISDIVVSADNVSFLVAENNTGKDRMATLTVSFPAAYEGEGVSTSLWISQSSEDAYLRFDSDEYAVNPDGGTVEVPYVSNLASGLYDYEITYELEADGGGDVDWLHNIVVENGSFTAEADPNKYEPRSARLKLSFTDDNGIAQSSNTIVLSQQKTTTGVVDGDGGDEEEPKDPETDF